MKTNIDPPVAVGMLGAFIGALTIGDAHPYAAGALGVWVTWCLFYYTIKNRH